MMLEKRITQLIEPVIQSLGLELWSCQLHQQKKSALLRIYIDKAGGVTLEDCTKVSREVGAILDVENTIQTRYELEVSSPGFERTLSTLSHFQQYIGSTVKMKLRNAVENQKNIEGVIQKIEADTIFLNAQDKTVEIKLTDIQKANLVEKMLIR